MTLPNSNTAPASSHQTTPRREVSSFAARHRRFHSAFTYSHISKHDLDKLKQIHLVTEMLQEETL